MTLAASAACEGDRPLALAEGRFTEDAVLSVVDSAQTPPAAGTGGDVWEISLTGTDEALERVPIRLLNRGGGKASVWRLDNGQWTAVKAQVNGSYLCLDMAGVSGVFCVHSAGGLSWTVLLAAAAALLAGLALLARRRQGKPKAQKAAK